MRKIYITEEQLDALKRQIAEQDEITIDAQPDANGAISTAGLKTQYNNTKANVSSGTNIKLSVDGADLAEGKFITKKQIQEAKLASLKKNCVVYKKGKIK